MDQYTAFEDKGISAGDIALSPFQLSTHLWAYGHIPGMWSGTKGMYVPFNTSASKKAMGAMKTSFGDKKYVAGVGNLLKGTVGSVRPFGFGGSRVLNFGEQIVRNDRIAYNIQQSKITNAGVASKLSKENINLMEKLKNYKTKYANKNSKYAGKKPNVVKNLAKQNAIRDTTANLEAKIQSNATKISAINNAYTYQDRAINKLANKKGMLTVGKYALRGAKVVSVVGAISLALDITRMIGEPIGRGLVGAADRALTSWEERFMPKIGGRLAMSYLSQGAATDRQRALQAMSNAQITGRSAFGQEARYSHS